MTHGRKFMVVDDEEDIRDMLAIALAQEGHSVTTAADRESALEMLESTKPDIMFLDFAMTGLGAEEFMRQLRRISPTTFVVLMTADYAAQKAQELGLNSYIQKPFELCALSKSANAWANHFANSRAVSS